jgi:hypothetical protein
MKKLYTILAAIILAASVFAQAPEKMSYQAVIRDASNDLVTGSVIGMQISLLQGSASGTAVYEETQTPTSNINGLVSIEIGSGTVVNGDFSAIDWVNGPYFIKTETDPAGGTNYTITGTSQLLSVPYALHAKTAESLTGAPGNFYLGQDTLGGIVYYIYKDAAGTQHGLIVNKTETTTVWQATGTLTNADRTEDGAYNTLVMTSSAAATYVTGLGAGWYLPSIDELCLLYYNRFSVNRALRLGGHTLLSKIAYYWSSTQHKTANAFTFNFGSGSVAGYAKSNTRTVRAVRAF